MRFAFGFVQLISCTSCDDIFLMADIMNENFLEVQRFRLAVDERQHIYRAGILKLSIAVKLIEDDLCVCIALYLNDDSHAALHVRFVSQCGNTLNTLVFNERRDIFKKQRAVDLIGKLSHDYRRFAALFFKMCLGSDSDSAVTGGIRLINAAQTVNNAGGGEIGSLDELHQIGDLTVGMIDEIIGRVNDLAEIMRRNICRHTDGYADGAVDKQVGEPAGKHDGFKQLVVEVGCPVNDILVDILEHEVRYLCHACFGITVCGCAVAVDIAEVTLTVDKRVSEREGLCHTHHGVVNSRVAVRVIMTQHVTDGGCRFAVRCVIKQLVLIH